eukprot:m.133498 g.133498  ORF g.133498 m.133498 type:complete len:127 (+) comp15801_c3_seq1:924-1304(+)
MQRAARLLRKTGDGENIMEMLKLIAQPPVARARPVLSRQDLDQRAHMAKEWSRFRMREENKFTKKMAEVIRCRDAALVELKQISPELYNKAMEIDPTPWPVEANYPLETPPIVGYNPQANVRSEEQ